MKTGVYYIPIPNLLIVLYSCAPQYSIFWFGNDYHIISNKLFRKVIKVYNLAYLGEY